MSGTYRWNLNPFIALFLSFFFTKIRREVEKSLRKLGLHIVNDWSVDCKKTDSLGAWSLTSQASAGCAFSCIMTCFSCAAMVFRYSKRARTFFTKYVPSRSFGGHVTWNSAVPDPDVWCCILLFLCTLGISYRPSGREISSLSAYCVCVGHEGRPRAAGPRATRVTYTYAVADKELIERPGR